MSEPCRCGFDGTGEHFCHRCHQRPGKTRIYIPTFKFSLAGAMRKYSVADTWGCDECWKDFSALLAANPDR